MSTPFALLALILVITVLTAASSEVGMPEPDDIKGERAESKGTRSAVVRNPAVQSGLEITVDGKQILLTAGNAKIGDRTVKLKRDARLDVSAPEPISVKEGAKLWPDPPRRWQSRTKLIGHSKGNRQHAPYLIIPGTVRLTNKKGVEYVRNKDYILDEDWNAMSIKKGGRLKEDVRYLVEYQLGPKALDAVILGANGKARVIKGEPAITIPFPPACPKDAVVLAHVYWPGAGRTRLFKKNIFPVGPAYAPPAKSPRMSARIPKTMAKLKAGEPVTIVCWGDSVTVGGDARPRAQMRYSTLFEKELKKRFPNARVANVAVGGSNSAQWTDPNNAGAIKRWGDKRPRWAWIAEKKPDLVTIEFVNDCGLRDWNVFEKHYGMIMDRLKKLNAEVILITPHFTMPSMMGFSGLRQRESRPYVRNLRRFAKERKLALADASRRWEHLWREGLPYLTLLPNGINHPDNRGHGIFAEELMRCFAD